MNKAWTTEYTRIFLLTAGGLFIGLVTGQWVVAVLLPCIAYIGWTLSQLKAFEQWIQQGAQVEQAPDANGIWQSIVQHVHRAQRKNIQQQKRLSNMVNRFETTISALPYATVILDADLDIVWANDAANGTLGVNKLTDIGQRFDNLVREPALQRVINDDSSKPMQLISPVNPAITLMVSCVVFGDNQRLITAKDVSQIISVQKLRKAFIANASHELRTPLTVISGYLEIMGSDDTLPPPLLNMINNAGEQSVRMQSILTDLLTLSKLEEKNQLYPKDSGETIHLATMIGKLVSTIEQSSRGHSVDLNVPDDLYMQASETEMFSLCQNLITNAVKYSDDNTVIKIDCQLGSDGAAMIKVQDRGKGIAPEDLTRLTERFFRVNDHRDHHVEGTGLGLSIVKHILENHGGHLDVESELGKGSVFTANLPDYRVVKDCHTAVI
ncbi:MAG: two-component system phosphate regulon sensor histidine kinase PhoR [Phenylobacterium sp.]|jgi:two-component system phosphate regulon sensor histidine kinase PhoR